MAVRQIGPFQLEKQIGVGGMGVVYLATYLKNGRKVALKLLSPAFSSDEDLLARFEREMKILKKLKNENIVQYFGGGRHGKQHFYAMELMPGGSLEELIKKKGRLPWEQVIELTLQMVNALEYAHKHQIIHRDLKPPNFLFDEAGKLKLSDFGIARDTQATALTAAGKTVGTYAYMAPEQISGGHPIAGKTDLYSLGCVMFQMLTGETPFQADSAAQMLFKHLDEKPPRVTASAIDCPVWLDAVVLKLLSKDPQDRYFDALTVQVALEEVLQKVAEQTSIAKQTTIGGPTSVTMDDVHPGLRKLLQSNKKKKKRRKKKKFVPIYERFWFLVICLFLLIGGVTWGIWPLSENELFTKAKVLMQSDDPDEWSKAREKYLDKLLAKYPDSQHATEAEEYIDRIEMHLAERRAIISAERNRKPKSIGEGMFVEAWRAEQARDRITALAKYRSMIELLKDSEKDRAYANLAKRKIIEIQQTGGDDDLKLINAAIRRAEEHLAKGEKLEADKTFSSIIEVYGSNQEFEVQVKYARDRREGKDVKPLNFGSSEDPM
jgi:hypothetical protein